MQSSKIFYQPKSVSKIYLKILIQKITNKWKSHGAFEYFCGQWGTLESKWLRTTDQAQYFSVFHYYLTFFSCHICFFSQFSSVRKYHSFKPLSCQMNFHSVAAPCQLVLELDTVFLLLSIPVSILNYRVRNQEPVPFLKRCFVFIFNEKKRLAAKQYQDNKIFLCWKYNLNHHYFLMIPNPIYSITAYKV